MCRRGCPAPGYRSQLKSAELPPDDSGQGSAVVKVSTDAAARTLWKHWCAGDQIRRLPPGQTPSDLDEAWRIHRALEHYAGGRVGWKVSATSIRTQAQLGLAEPMVGALYSGVLVGPGEAISPTQIGIIEAEFAFTIRGRLAPEEAPFDRATILSHVAGVHAGLEVPDTRLARYPRLSPPEMLADFMLSRYYLVGDQLHVDPRSLADVTVKVWRDDRLEDVGTGADALGDPVSVLVWLANKLASLGEAIEDGDLITTGGCAEAKDVVVGETISAEFGGGHRLSLAFAQF